MQISKSRQNNFTHSNDVSCEFTGQGEKYTARPCKSFTNEFDKLRNNMRGSEFVVPNLPALEEWFENATDGITVRYLFI